MLAAAALSATPAVGQQDGYFNEARSGGTYFNRPGASSIEHNADLTFCSQYLLSPPGSDALVNQNIASFLIWSGAVNRFIASTNAARLEACMVASGWRVYRASASDGPRLDAADGATVAATVEPWIGMPNPPGTLLRVWGNEAHHPAKAAWAANPKAPEAPSLSARLLNRAAIRPAIPPPAVQSYSAIQRNKRAEAPAPPAGMAVILFHVTGAGGIYGNGVGFVEQAAEGEATNRTLRFIQGVSGNLSLKREGNWYSFTVPAGRWMYGESGRYNLCLGAPSFDVPTGAVIYAGSFDLDGEVLGPDLDLARVREHLRGDAGARVQAAVYDQNGGDFPCFFFGPPYALELEGVPFRPGYRRGSRAATVQ